MISVVTFLVASLLIDLPVKHFYILIPALFLVGWFFASLGVLVGVRAEQFDDVSFAQTFILQPLIFLGGVFYSASLLRALRNPDPFQPGLLRMISLVRCRFLGVADISVWLSLCLLTAATAALTFANYRMFKSGYKLRR